MSGIAVYMEGGGDSKEGKARLRQGMSEFLRTMRDAARHKNLHWRVVTCGGRDQAHDAFLNATRLSPGVINFLLVDSEGPVGNPGLPRAHLKHCDGWELASISEAAVHLMVQLMEAWLLADSDTVAAYYGQHFLKAAIPTARNLERVDKAQIEDALKRATARTTKGEYQKIRDAAALLQRIDPQIVRSRCPSCAPLFMMLDRAIRAAG